MEKGLKVKEHELRKGKFNKNGSFSEHIELGIKYDPSTGIYGMDFCEHLLGPGDSVQATVSTVATKV